MGNVAAAAAAIIGFIISSRTASALTVVIIAGGRLAAVTFALAFFLGSATITLVVGIIIPGTAAVSIITAKHRLLKSLA